MSGWGVFLLRDDDETVVEVHVAPCGDGDELSRGHTLDETCACGPVLEPVIGGKPFYLHNLEQ